MEMIQEIREAQFRREQQMILWGGVCEVITEAEEKKPEYWAKRIFTSFCRRFWHITKYSWVEILGEMNDGQAWGRYIDAKSRGYCMLMRDWARCQTKGEQYGYSRSGECNGRAQREPEADDTVPVQNAGISRQVYLNANVEGADRSYGRMVLQRLLVAEKGSGIDGYQYEDDIPAYGYGRKNSWKL